MVILGCSRLSTSLVATPVYLYSLKDVTLASNDSTDSYSKENSTFDEVYGSADSLETMSFGQISTAVRFC